MKYKKKYGLILQNGKAVKNEMLKIAVVDDEQAVCETLTRYMKHFSNVEQIPVEISCYSSGVKFLETVPFRFDAVFLDIEMPALDGMETAREIRGMDENICIVFITNMAHYAIQGYEVNALDFIVKPVEYAAFARMMKKVCRFSAKYKTENSLTIKIDREIKKVAISDILYIETEGSYLIYHILDGTYRVRGTLKNIEKELERQGFLRCNHCYLVNAKYITDVKKDSVLVRREELKISRNKKKEFMEKLTQYLGENMI